MEKEGLEKISLSAGSSPIFKQPVAVATVAPRKRNKHKRKKNKARYQQFNGVIKQYNKKKNQGNTNMNSLSDTFSTAATWQYKHQIAYWKAKAKALEYENRVLHGVIRKNHLMNAPSSSEASASEAASDIDIEIDHSDDEHCPPVDEDPDLEVSEDFIQFLASNAKYKEEARLERERLRAEQVSETEDDRVQRMEAAPVQTMQERSQDLKELYGSHWQSISALEMSLQSQFMSSCDRYKPDHWPNIPFNFNYS